MFGKQGLENNQIVKQVFGQTELVAKVNNGDHD